MPLVINETQRENLRVLLEQDTLWVRRARWARWLDEGATEHTCAIADMDHDSRIAAAAWLHQQQHTLHATVHGGIRARDGWIESLPLYRALRDA